MLQSLHLPCYSVKSKYVDAFLSTAAMKALVETGEFRAHNGENFLLDVTVNLFSVLRAGRPGVGARCGLGGLLENTQD